MLTSRAEFRLLLRHDNADIRLTEYGYDVGLIQEERYQNFLKKKQDIERLIRYLEETFVTPKKEINDYLTDHDLTNIKGKTSLYDLLKRPDMTMEIIKNIAPMDFNTYTEVEEQVEINVKYAGYIEKAIKEANKLKKEENIKIPRDLDFNQVPNLALEARSKLNQIRPLTISQATRISGVNPSDIQMLLIYLKKKYET